MRLRLLGLILSLPLILGIRDYIYVHYLHLLLPLAIMNIRTIKLDFSGPFWFILTFGLMNLFIEGSIYRYIVESFIYYFVFKSLSRNEIIKVIDTIFSIICLIYFLWLFDSHLVSLLSRGIYLASILESEAALGHDYVLESMDTKIDGFTALAYSSLLLQPFLIIYSSHIIYNKGLRNFRSILSIVISLSVNERMMYISILVILVLYLRKKSVHWLYILICHFLIGQFLGKYDFRLAMPWSIFTNGKIYSIRYWEYPEVWNEIASKYDMYVTDIFTGQTIIIGSHNFFWEYPLRLGLVGVFLLLIILRELNRIAKTSEQWIKVALFCLVIWMSFHNNGIGYLPMWYFLLVFIDGNKQNGWVATKYGVI